jgi:hypothetical protein
VQECAQFVAQRATVASLAALPSSPCIGRLLLVAFAANSLDQPSPVFFSRSFPCTTLSSSDAMVCGASHAVFVLVFSVMYFISHHHHAVPFYAAILIEIVYPIFWTSILSTGFFRLVLSVLQRQMS